MSISPHDVVCWLYVAFKSLTNYSLKKRVSIQHAYQAFTPTSFCPNCHPLNPCLISLSLSHQDIHLLYYLFIQLIHPLIYPSLQQSNIQSHADISTYFSLLGNLGSHDMKRGGSITGLLTLQLLNSLSRFKIFQDSGIQLIQNIFIRTGQRENQRS